MSDPKSFVQVFFFPLNVDIILNKQHAEACSVIWSYPSIFLPIQYSDDKIRFKEHVSQKYKNRMIIAKKHIYKKVKKTHIALAQQDILFVTKIASCIVVVVVPFLLADLRPCCTFCLFYVNIPWCPGLRGKKLLFFTLPVFESFWRSKLIIIKTNEQTNTKKCCH